MFVGLHEVLFCDAVESVTLLEIKFSQLKIPFDKIYDSFNEIPSWSFLPLTLFIIRILVIQMGELGLMGEIGN